MTTLEFATEKFGGHPHYRSDFLHLGDDPAGSWFWGAAGRTIRRGDQAIFSAPEPSLLLVTSGDWWVLTWFLGHPAVDLYVNIGTPPVREASRIVSVDLDLDVVRFNDGRTEIVDQDEFADHQVRYGYPPDLITGAERAAATALERMTRNAPPFDGAAARQWISRAPERR